MKFQSLTSQKLVNKASSQRLARHVKNGDSFKSSIMEFHKLLELISLSLGLAGDKFHDCFKNQLSMVRLNRYPPCPFPDLALGVGRHTDPGALTVLAQDEVGGLQVKRKTVGDWIPVKPTPGAFIINVGDVVQVWTNDKYQSVEHRAVVNTQKERISIPLFFYPGHHVMVKPAEELVNDKNPIGGILSTQFDSTVRSAGTRYLQS